MGVMGIMGIIGRVWCDVTVTESWVGDVFKGYSDIVHNWRATYHIS